jgi:hypothetical protein
MNKLIQNLEVNDLDVPMREGIITLVVNGMKLNDLLENVQSIPLKGQIIINDYTIDVENVDEMQLQ